MADTTIAGKAGRGVALAAALLATAAFTAAPVQARGWHGGGWHGGGWGWGPAVGLGLGAFALGATVGAAANPYYYGYPYYAPGYAYYGNPYYGAYPSTAYYYPY
ncbi:MAG TPA: hypothetical protein VME41_12900 [Stellaceae bacterium]|nr:hypothetical protein [Stellaceae bacterium]